MLPLVSIGIVAGLLLGFLSVAAAGKLYHLLPCNKKRVSSDSHRPEDVQLKQEIRNAAAGWLFCRPKPYSLHNTKNNNAVTRQRDDDNEDVELGLGFRMKSFVEEGVEAELMRLPNFCGPPRVLFTIMEETPEDLASEDGNLKCRTTSTRLIDLMRAADANFQLESPAKKKPSSSPLYSNKFVNNPLFECSVEAELNRLMASPPPKFKFLRDAEEKLLKKLEAERQQQRQPCSEVVSVPAHNVHVQTIN